MTPLILSSIFCFMNKDEFRKTYLARRTALTKSEHEELSQKIADLFFLSVDLDKIQNLHVFLPIVSKREPNTWIIIERLQKEFPHIRLIIPRVMGEGMENIFLEGPHQLEKTRWDMVEPMHGLVAAPPEIDLVLVPLLVVDMEGHRIGYGKGYYDRFLKLCRPDCIKTGVSFFDPTAGITEKSDNDVLLNSCLTPGKFHTFQ